MVKGNVECFALTGLIPRELLHPFLVVLMVGYWVLRSPARSFEDSSVGSVRPSSASPRGEDQRSRIARGLDHRWEWVRSLLSENRLVKDPVEGFGYVFEGNTPPVLLFYDLLGLAVPGNVVSVLEYGIPRQRAANKAPAHRRSLSRSRRSSP